MTFDDVRLQQTLQLIKNSSTILKEKGFIGEYTSSLNEVYLFNNQIRMLFPSDFTPIQLDEKLEKSHENTYFYTLNGEDVNFLIQKLDYNTTNNDLNTIFKTVKTQIRNSVKDVVFLKSDLSTMHIKTLRYRFLYQQCVMCGVDVFYELQPFMLHIAFAYPYKNRVHWEQVLEEIIKSVTTEMGDENHDEIRTY